MWSSEKEVNVGKWDWQTIQTVSILNARRGYLLIVTADSRNFCKQWFESQNIIGPFWQLPGLL